MSERVVIGIDLGTTNSLVCTYMNNELVMIPNRFGSVLTPSIVSFDEEGNVYVGQVAKERMIANPNMSVASFKRFMGSNKRFKLGEASWKAEELSAFILRELIEDAKRYLGKDIDEAIISVPAYFNDDSRNATKNAGALANVHVSRVINEPSAAALAARSLHDVNDCMMLVVDMGGGTLDVSLVECFGDIVSVLAVSGDNYLGGDDFDACIARYFCKCHNVDFDSLQIDTRNIVLKSAEICKRNLSVQEEVQMQVSTKQIQGTLTMSRKQLIHISQDLFTRIQKPIAKVFNDAGVRKEDIDEVILVGGGCKIHVVSKFISHLMSKETLNIGEMDQIVAMGVGVYSGIRARKEDIKQLVLTDICPFSLGIAIHNPAGTESLSSIIIERNTALPTSRVERYYPVHANQKIITIKVFQGESMYTKDNIFLGELEVPLPNTENKAVDIRLTYDINGILQVEATAVHSNIATQGVILSKGAKGMSEEEIEAKLKAYDSYKKQDVQEEQFVFLKNTAESLYEQISGENRERLNERHKSFIMEFKGTSSQKLRNNALESFWSFLNVMKDYVQYDPFEQTAAEYWSWYEEEEESEKIFS